MIAHARRQFDYVDLGRRAALPASLVLLILAISYFVAAARAPAAIIGRMWFSTEVDSIVPLTKYPLVEAGQKVYLQHEIEWRDDSLSFLDYGIVDSKGKWHPYAERQIPKQNPSEFGIMVLHSRQFEIPKLPLGRSCYQGTVRSYRWPWDWWQWPGPIKVELPRSAPRKTGAPPPDPREPDGGICFIVIASSAATAH